MNGYECDGTEIFSRRKMECSLQRGEAKLNRTFHISPDENICTIAGMKNNHYLFYITSKKYFCHLERLINLQILENANSVLIAPCKVNGHRSVPLKAELYYCMVLLNIIT